MSTILNQSVIFGNHDDLPTTATFSLGAGVSSFQFFLAFQAIDLAYLSEFEFNYNSGTGTDTVLTTCILSGFAHTGDTVTSFNLTMPGSTPNINTTITSNQVSVQGSISYYNSGGATVSDYIISSSGTTTSATGAATALAPNCILNEIILNNTFFPDFETVKLQVQIKSPGGNLPGNPVNLQALQGPGSDVVLNWTQDIETGLLYFTMYRGNGLGVGFSSTGSIASISPTTLTSYLDTTTVFGGQYTYYLTATNSFGEGPPSNAATIALPSYLPETAMLSIGRLPGGPRTPAYSVSIQEDTFISSVGVFSTILPPESINLASATGSAGATLSLSGTTTNGPAASMDYTLDAGSTWNSCTAYSGGATWTASGGTLSAGTFTVETRDHVNQSVISNARTLIVAPGESITITAAGATAGAVALMQGQTVNGPASAMDYSRDHGSTWEPVQFYDPGTGSPATWGGATSEIYSAGTFTLKARDHLQTSIQSNDFTFTVAPPESITLSSISGTVGQVLAFTGQTNNGPPAAQDYYFIVNTGTIDFVPAWAELVNYSNSGTVDPRGFSGNGTETLSTQGTFIGQTRDHNNPSILSNIVTFVIAPEETLTILSAGGYVGQPVNLTGSSDFGPSSALDVSVDSGSWVALGSYTTLGGTLAVPWQGQTVGVAAGDHTAQVRDHTNTYVVSNIFPFSVGNVPQPETIILDFAACGVGGILTLSGTSNNGPPVGLDVTLDGGATWQTLSQYTSAEGTNAAPWSGLGPNLLV